MDGWMEGGMEGCEGPTSVDNPGAIGPIFTCVLSQSCVSPAPSVAHSGLWLSPLTFPHLACLVHPNLCAHGAPSLPSGPQTLHLSVSSLTSVFLFPLMLPLDGCRAGPLLSPGRGPFSPFPASSPCSNSCKEAGPSLL